MDRTRLARSAARDDDKHVPAAGLVMVDAAAASAPEAPQGRGRRVTSPGIVLLVASGGVFTAFVDATIVNTIFPEIEKAFSGASIGALSWIFNAYSIVTAAFLIPAGRIADVVGRRRVFRIGLVTFTVGSILCALAPSLTLLVAARVVQALGGALLIPTSLALVLDAYPATSRSKGVALWSAAATLAAGVGPAAGGLLVELSGWRLAFLVNVPVGIAIFVVTGRTIVESRSPGKRAMPDIAGSAVLALALGALILAIVKVNDWGVGSAGFAACCVVFLVTFGVFALRTRSHAAPLVDLDLLRAPSFALANVLMVLAGLAFYAYLLCNVLFLTTIWHYSVLDAGLALTPGPFIATATAGLFAKVTARFGFRVALVAGALVWAAGVLWMITRVGTHPDFVGQWLPGMLILGVGAGATFPTLSSLAIAASPRGSFATATALNAVARQLGAALGVALLVAIVGTPSPTEVAGAFDRGWTLSVVAFGFVALLALGVRRLEAAGEEPVLPARPPMSSALRPLEVTAGAGAAGRLSAFFAEAAAPTEETVQDVLARTSWFGSMPASVVAAVADAATTRTVSLGDAVYLAGDPGETIFVVRSGRVSVRSPAGREPVELGRGTVLGAVTALARGVYADTVVAMRTTELIAVDRGTVTRLAGRRPDLSLALITAMSQRLEQAPRGPVRPQSPAVIALVPLDAGVDMRRVSSRLSDAFGRLGTAGLLTGRERTVAPGEGLSTVFGPLLARSERDVDRTLLVASADLVTPWSAFCLRQADRVLAISSTGELPRTYDLGLLRGCDLVLLGRDTAASTPLVEALRPGRRHRVGDSADDIDRIARRLCGKSIGLVLSGGGARALGHLGVLNELLAAGIRIDRVGGTSMGAYLSSLIATGMSLEEIDATCYDTWVRGNPIADYTLPRAGLIRGRAIKQVLAETFGDRRIEDLERSFYCVASDLRAQSKVVFREGLVRDAVTASMCLPLLAPPQVVGEQLLVDGALLDNLPVEDMAMAGEGPVLAVDIRPESEPDGPDAHHPSRPPGMMDTLSRMLWLASANTSAQAAMHADRLIPVAIGGVGLLEFHQMDAAVAAGAAAARAALNEHGPTLGLT